MAPGKLRPAKEYGFDEKNGYLYFLDREVPLPPEFDLWKDLAENYANNIENGTIRAKVDKMPQLDHTKLVTRDEKIFARMMVAAIAHSYVRGGSVMVTDADGTEREVSVPKQVAVPLWGLSQDLGLDPIFNYTDCVSFCARRTASFDHHADHEEMVDKMTMRYPFPGGDPNIKFMNIVNCTELRFVDMFHLFPKVVSGDEQAMTEGLEEIAKLLEQVRQTFALFPKYADPEAFVSGVVPYMQGFGYDPAGPFVEGLVYDGIPAGPQKLNGPSGGQSTMFHCLDELFGVQHDAKRQTHIDKNRAGMYPEQRLLILDLRRLCIKDQVMESENAALKAAFERCVKGLQQCRAAHLAGVHQFVIHPVQRAGNGPDDPRLAHPSTEQSLAAYLGALRQDTITLQKAVNRD